MKKATLTIILACFTMALSAQETIRVNYKGAKPSIVDFAWAYLTPDVADEPEEDAEATAGVSQALYNYRKGIPLEEGETITVDQKNGYILYERKWDDGSMVRTEMCYWNESDGKHKLFAYSNWYYENGKPAQGQYDCVTFYRYNNATKIMKHYEDPGFRVDYDHATYSLPRTGKDIIVNKWDKNGKKTQKTLKWNGRKFNF